MPFKEPSRQNSKVFEIFGGIIVLGLFCFLITYIVLDWKFLEWMVEIIRGFIFIIVIIGGGIWVSIYMIGESYEWFKFKKWRK